jgi:putative transposase
MALDHAALLEVLDVLKAGDAGERVRVAAETMYQALIETELSATIGAQPWEHSPSRTNQRNGSRSRTLSTTAGDLQLRIPKLRTGSFYPALLDRRRRVDHLSRDTWPARRRQQPVDLRCCANLRLDLVTKNSSRDDAQR